MPNAPVRSLAVCLSTLLLFQLLAAAPAFSWYDRGHRIAGLIAQAHLTNEARKEINRILPSGMTLADAAVWPDHEGRSVREFDPLHYANVAENADAYDQKRDCSERNCMVEALSWFSKAVADNTAPMALRRLALYYVVHLVGDVHQPLHTGRAKDRGGVEIQVSYRGAATNLHYFWDSNLVDLEPGTEEEIATRLTGNLSDEERTKWQSSDARNWTNESLMLVRSHGYNTGASSELSDEYVERARPIVRTRLAQAGIRLAGLLNTIFKEK
jgi:hypothetical protein